LPRDKGASGPVSLRVVQGEGGDGPGAWRSRKGGSVEAIPVIGLATRTVRLHFSGELRRVRDFVDPIRQQMDAGMTRLLVTIDELSLDGEVGLLALEDIRASRAECGAVIMWSRSPSECFGMGAGTHARQPEGRPGG
jgi:hypothetical protein